METIRRRGSLATEGKSVPQPGKLAMFDGKTGIDLVAIGSSTGGPPALQKIFSEFPQGLSFAVMVSQHMPGGFTKAFAERLNRLCPFPIKEAAQGDRVVPGQVYIAPGGFNMLVERVNNEITVQLVEPSSKDRYVPSVDAMFSSLTKVYGDRLLSVVLTGMGNDGSQGIKAVKGGGGKVFAESEESAIVYGMPREAVASGLVDKVVHLDAMAKEILLACRSRSTN